MIPCKGATTRQLGRIRALSVLWFEHDSALQTNTATETLIADI